MSGEMLDRLANEIAEGLDLGVTECLASKICSDGHTCGTYDCTNFGCQHTFKCTTFKCKTNFTCGTYSATSTPNPTPSLTPTPTPMV